MQKISDPLVSVVIPVFNGEETILFALSSLLAQTYSRWEALVIDDGSTDRTLEVLSLISDPRIKIYKLQVNQGRAAARQRGLDEASGDFLAMLDSDDWLCSRKLEIQVQELAKSADLAAVSGGMFITGDGVSVRARIESRVVERALANPVKYRIPHASTMVRMSVAKNVAYDSRLKYGEDGDFLARAIYSRAYKILPTPVYVYSEQSSVNVRKVLTGYILGSLSHLKWFSAFPLSVLYKVGGNLVKCVVVCVAASTGLFGSVLDSRSRTASAAELEFYEREWQIVSAIYDKLLNSLY